MTSSETPTMMLDRLADAAWKQLADLSPRAIHIDDIATDAGIPPRPHVLSPAALNLVLNKLARLDRQAVLETLADIEDAGDVPVRDKIIEGLMHRFEVYAPYRRQMAQLENAARRDPALGLRLIDSLVHAMRMLLRMAGDDLAGVRGEARVRGVAAVAMLVARTWQTDNTTDLSTTLKEIDRRLATAEEWGRTLRVLDSDSLEEEPMGAGQRNSEDPLDGNPGGRYQ